VSVSLDINSIDLERDVQPGEFMRVEGGEVSMERLISC
jgi:hypothetical protein